MLAGKQLSYETKRSSALREGANAEVSSNESFALRPAVACLAGMLIGLGSRLSGGCTSGHGICGLPRFSLRSLVAVCTFMASGACTAVLCHSLGSPWRARASKQRAWTTDTSLYRALFASTACVLLLPVLRASLWQAGDALMQSDSPHERTADLSWMTQPGSAWSKQSVQVHTMSFLCGCLFAMGLCVSGMTSQAKVLAFLNPWAKREGWDPTLAAVMAGGVLGNAVTFWYLHSRHDAPWLLSPTATALDECIALGSCARNNHVDGKLLAGAALFGVGWGLAGQCPGPALVQLGAGDSTAAYLVPGMLLGMAALRVIGAAGTGTCA